MHSTAPSSSAAPLALSAESPARAAAAPSGPRPQDGPAAGPSTWVRWVGAAPFLAVHLALAGIAWSGVTLEALVCCAVLFVVRMFGVTGGYHRYFAHRTFKTSRAMQFVLAFLAQSSAQKGVLWWAAHHRHHHKHSDDEQDVHSPVQRGFWYSHVGWIYNGNDETRWDRIKDFAQYPELRWLNRYWLVPPVVTALGVWAVLGWSGLFVGFFLSTVLLWHGTFFINSLAHVFGSRRFATKDDSRNSFLLALLTLGEGWHNNHHHYPSATRQGFYWWEIDLTYYALRVMSWMRLVWGLREPPRRVLEAGRVQAKRAP